MSTIIKGDGSYNFVIEVDGDDLLVRNAKITWFGGPANPVTEAQLKKQWPFA